MFLVAPYSNPEISQTVTRYTALKVNDELEKILASKPDYLKLIIPLESGSTNLTLELFKVDISPNGYSLLTSDNSQASVKGILNSTVNYRGIIENDVQSVVSFSFSRMKPWV